jgi:hypothetical protein
LTPWVIQSTASRPPRRRPRPAATTRRPALRAVSALRGLVEVLEALQVDNARAKGWSWQQIATVLGLTKQAVHHKHGPHAKGRDVPRSRAGRPPP